MARLQRFALGISLLAVGLVCFAWGADPPKSEPAKKNTSAPTGDELVAKIAQLEKRILKLEQERDLRVLPVQDNMPNAAAVEEEDEWKSRATGSRVVNGMRVYFLPLSQRKD